MVDPASVTLPLSGIRVLDFTRFLAGPYCGSILADLGADVIRIESVGGAEDRQLVPLGATPGGALFLQANRNKRSLAIDLTHEQGRQAVNRLIAGADVVLTNMPGRVLKKLALDFDALRAIKPTIVAANISAYGMTGRLRDRTGFDGIGQAMNGSAYLAGMNERSPRRAGCSWVDYGTGLALAMGVLAALIQRDRTGEGQDVQTSLLATALTFANGWHIEESVLGLGRRPFGNRSPNSGPSDIYRTKDGHIVVQTIGAPMFERWAQLMGRPELLMDQRLRTDPDRGRHGKRLSRIMGRWTAQRTSVEAIDALAKAGVAAGPVYTPRQVLSDELIAETGVFQPLAHPGLDRPAPLTAPIVQLGGVDLSIRQCAPYAGEQSADILREIGLSDEDIAALLRNGVVSSETAESAASHASV